MKVTHAQFGTGTVISQDANNVTVDFNGTTKTLIIKFARLMNEDGTAFGSQFVSEKKTKKTNSQKRLAFERTLTDAQKMEMSFLNPDGTKNYEAYNDFLDRRESAKWSSKSF